MPLPAEREALERFADPVYLHQVMQRNQDGSLQHYPVSGGKTSAEGNSAML